MFKIYMIFFRTKTLVRDTRANILINSCQRLVSNRPAKSKRERKSMEFLVVEEHMINTTQKVNLKMENRLELGLGRLTRKSPFIRWEKWHLK